MVLAFVFAFGDKSIFDARLKSVQERRFASLTAADFHPGADFKGRRPVREAELAGTG